MADNASKAFYRLDSQLRTALVNLVGAVCPDNGSWWKQHQPPDEGNISYRGSQTRSLLTAMVNAMARNHVDKATRQLFPTVHVSTRFFFITKYLRDCCNKHRYYDLASGEELGDLLLIDEFLVQCEKLHTDPIPGLGKCRQEISGMIASRLSDELELRGVTASSANDPVGNEAPKTSDTREATGPAGQAAPRPEELAAIRDELQHLTWVVHDTWNMVSDARIDLTGRVASLAQAMAELPRAHALEGPAVEVEPEDATVEEPTWSAVERWNRTLLTPGEARAHLMSLRRQIWDELGTGPSADGVLRKSLLDLYVGKRITSEAALRQHGVNPQSIDPRQYKYLREIFSIVDRLPRRS